MSLDGHFWLKNHDGDSCNAKLEVSELKVCGVTLN